MRIPTLFFVGRCISISAARVLAVHSQQQSQQQTQQAPKTIHQLFLGDQEQNTRGSQREVEAVAGGV
jgi:hypothetical protein